MSLSRPAHSVVRFLTSGAVAAGLALGSVAALGPTAAAAGKPNIDGSFAVGASKSSKGGIWLPFAWCGDDVLDGPSSYKARIIRGGKTVARRSEPTDVRVKAGTYTVKTTVKCGSQSKTFTEKVKVERKTDRNTISRSEYNRIKDGMTLAKVKKIVGTKGELLFEDAGMSERYFEGVGYGDLAVVAFEDGRVVEKDYIDF